MSLVLPPALSNMWPEALMSPVPVKVDAEGKSSSEEGAADADVAPPRGALCIGGVTRRETRIAEVVLRRAVLHHADQHRRTGAEEPGAPVPRFTDGAGDANLVPNPGLTPVISPVVEPAPAPAAKKAPTKSKGKLPLNSNSSK